MGKCVENKAKMKILTNRFCNRPNNSLMLEFLLNRSFSFFLIWTVQLYTESRLRVKTNFKKKLRTFLESADFTTNTKYSTILHKAN